MDVRVEVEIVRETLLSRSLALKGRRKTDKGNQGLKVGIPRGGTGRNRGRGGKGVESTSERRVVAKNCGAWV